MSRVMPSGPFAFTSEMKELLAGLQAFELLFLAL